MKKPYLTYEERQLIYHNTSIGQTFMVELRKQQFKREVSKTEIFKKLIILLRRLNNFIEGNETKNN